MTEVVAPIEIPIAGLRRLAKQAGPIGVYARLEIAIREERGVRLTYDECVDIVHFDQAVLMAIEEAYGELVDADEEGG